MRLAADGPAARVREPVDVPGRRAITCSRPRGWCAASCSGGSRSTRTAPSGSWTCATRPPATCSPSWAGKVGERYLLGGRNFTFERLFADLGRMSGVPTPVRIPPRPAAAAAAVLGLRGRSWPLTPAEVRAAGHSWTYRSTKAQRALGWKARPHEETLEATVAWHLEREHERITRTRRSQGVQYRLAGAALGAADEHAGTGAPRSGCRRSGRLPPPGRGGGGSSLGFPASRNLSLHRTSHGFGDPSNTLRRVTTLYRCKAPTDLVCRCGKVARRMRAMGTRLRRGPRTVPEARPARGRGVDRPEMGTGPRARRRCDSRLAPDTGVPRMARSTRRLGGGGPRLPRRPHPERRARRPPRVAVRADGVGALAEPHAGGEGALQEAGPRLRGPGQGAAGRAAHRKPRG